MEKASVVCLVVLAYFSITITCFIELKIGIKLLSAESKFAGIGTVQHEYGADSSMNTPDLNVNLKRSRLRYDDTSLVSSDV
jgi:hypothetical protein